MQQIVRKEIVSYILQILAIAAIVFVGYELILALLMSMLPDPSMFVFKIADRARGVREAAMKTKKEQ